MSLNKHHRADESTLRELGALIATRRREQGKTAEDVAEAVGMSPSCLSRIENGSREIRLGVLHRLCGVLRMWDDIHKYLKTGKFQ